MEAAAGGKMKKVLLDIKNMHCENCAKTIKNLFWDEGLDADIDFNNNKAEISLNKEEERLKILKILALLRKRGYKTEVL